MEHARKPYGSKAARDVAAALGIDRVDTVISLANQVAQATDAVGATVADAEEYGYVVTELEPHALLKRCRRLLSQIDPLQRSGPAYASGRKGADGTWTLPGWPEEGGSRRVPAEDVQGLMVEDYLAVLLQAAAASLVAEHRAEQHFAWVCGLREFGPKPIPA